LSHSGISQLAGAVVPYTEDTGASLLIPYPFLCYFALVSCTKIGENEQMNYFNLLGSEVTA